MVQENAVRETLCPWLGTAFLSWCDVCNQACGLLNGADCSQAGLDALYGALDRLLFHTLRDGTRGDMRILLDDGRTVRVRLDDVDQMADAVSCFGGSGAHPLAIRPGAAVCSHPQQPGRAARSVYGLCRLSNPG